MFDIVKNIAFSTVVLLALICMSDKLCRADLPVLDPSAKSTTRIAPFFQIALNVSVRNIDEMDLCGVFPVDIQGNVQLNIGGQPIPKIRISGLTVNEARFRFVDALKKYYAVLPDVKVGITKIPRMKVNVFGATLRSGPVSLIEGSHLSDALAECQYTPKADLSNIQIARIEKEGGATRLNVDFRKALTGDSSDSRNDPELKQGDVITINGIAEMGVKPRIAVIGEVKRPSFIDFVSGMTVKDALREAIGLKDTANSEAVSVVRKATGIVLTINARRAIEGVATDNLELMPDDVIMVSTRDRSQRYSVVGQVAAPQTVDFKKAVTLTQAIADAGGVKPDGDRHNVILLRQMILDPAHSEPVVLDLDRIVRHEMPDVQLAPGDVVQIPPKRKAVSPLVNIGMFILRRFIPFP